MKIVSKKGIRSFTCFDQFLCMALERLTYRDRVLDIEYCISVKNVELYHIKWFNTTDMSDSYLLLSSHF